jgi:hypothetical protein
MVSPPHVTARVRYPENGSAAAAAWPLETTLQNLIAPRRSARLRAPNPGSVKRRARCGPSNQSEIG